MSSGSYTTDELETFCQKFLDLMAYLRSKWSDDSDLRRLELQLVTAFDLGLSAKRTVLDYFIKHVTKPFWQQIKSGDEDFFLSKDDLAHSDAEEGVDELIQHIKMLWSTLNERPRIKHKILTMCQQITLDSMAISGDPVLVEAARTWVLELTPL